MKLFDNIKILFWATLAACSLTSCLGTDESETVVMNYYNAIVTKFALTDNTNVATGLNKYDFTIDNFGTSDAAIHAQFPNDGIIFNADSLPYGTIADSVKVTISYSSPDSAYFCLYSLDGKLHQYTNVASDSALYFASYPDARLNLSARGFRKVYHVKINVHKVAGDTIKWHPITDELWGNAPIIDQRADTLGSTAYWYIQTRQDMQVITADLSSRPDLWTQPAKVNVEDDALLDLHTIYNWHNALYAVGLNNGKLYSTTDGYNWLSTNGDHEFATILGNQLATRDVYGNWNKDSLSVIVREKDTNTYRFAVSADAKEWRIDKQIPTGFPVRGFTRPVSMDARAHNGNLTSRLYVIGGMSADGSYTSSTWSCDGFNETEGQRNWAEFPHSNVPAMQSGHLVEYTLDSDKPKTFWILYPGFDSSNNIITSTHYGRKYATLYYSEDYGVSWHVLYDKYPKMSDNSAFSGYVPTSVFCYQKDFKIYVFGGLTPDGAFSTKVWSGLLPSLTFTKVR